MVGRGIIPLALALLLCLGGSLARAQTIIALHSFDLTRSLDDEAGGPALLASGGTVTDGGYVFEANQGLQLTSPLPDPASFTIAVEFLLDATGGYRKLIDFQSRGSDSGFYNYGGHLSFYPNTTSAQPVFTPGLPAMAVLTRDGATSIVTGYVNGVPVISFTDSSGLAVLNSPATGLFFFMDDFATGQGEASGGLARRLLLFDGALSGGQVLALSQGQLPVIVPEPATVALLTLGLGLVALFHWHRQRRG